MRWFIFYLQDGFGFTWAKLRRKEYQAIWKKNVIHNNTVYSRGSAQNILQKVDIS